MQIISSFMHKVYMGNIKKCLFSLCNARYSDMIFMTNRLSMRGVL